MNEYIRMESPPARSPVAGRDVGAGHGRAEVDPVLAAEFAQLLLLLLTRRAEVRHSDRSPGTLLRRCGLISGDNASVSVVRLPFPA